MRWRLITTEDGASDGTITECVQKKCSWGFAHRIERRVTMVRVRRRWRRRCYRRSLIGSALGTKRRRSDFLPTRFAKCHRGPPRRVLLRERVANTLPARNEFWRHATRRRFVELTKSELLKIRGTREHVYLPRA